MVVQFGLTSLPVHVVINNGIAMKVEIVKSERLYLKVADQIASLIRSGELEKGRRLPSERDLADMFGVSRPSIREAMIALEISGMVDIRSGSGVYVVNTGNPMSILSDAPGPIEMLEARMLIEGEAAALAASRLTDDDLTLIKQCLDEIEDENSAIINHEQADENFHMAIAQASRNSALFGTIKNLWNLRQTTPIAKFMHSKLRDRGVKPVIEQHRAIYDALVARDSDAARLAMQNHLKSVIESVIDNQ